MKKSEEDRLTAKERKAIELLATGMKHKDVAATVGVAPQTISTWLSDPEFRAALNTLLAEVLEGTRVRLLSVVAKAMTVLDDLLEVPSPEIRLEAVREALKLLPDADRKLPAIGPTDVKRVMHEDNLKIWQQAEADHLERSLYPHRQYRRPDAHQP